MSRRAFSTAVSTFAMIAFSGCTNGLIDVGGTASPSVTDSGIADAQDAGDAYVPFDGQAPPGTPLARALAVCADPTHGPVDPVSEANTAAKLLDGEWISCTRDASGDYFRRGGIQFTADGIWYVLRLEADGTVTRLMDSESSGTWKYDQGNLALTITGGGALSGPFGLETAPRRLFVGNVGSNVTPTWLVPL